MYTPNLHFTVGMPTLNAPVPTSSSIDAQIPDVLIPSSAGKDTPVLETRVLGPSSIDTPIADRAAPSTVRVDTAVTQISGTSHKNALRPENPTTNTPRVGSSSPSTIISRKPLSYPLDEENSIANAQMPTPLIVTTACSNGPMQTSRAQGASAASTPIQDITTMNSTILYTSIPNIIISRATPPSDVPLGPPIPGSLTQWTPHQSTPVAITTSSSVEGVLDVDRPTVRAHINTTTIRIHTDTPATSTLDTNTLATKSSTKPTPGRPSTAFIPVRSTPNSKSHITPHGTTAGPPSSRALSQNKPRRPSWAIDQPPHSRTFHYYQDLVPPPRSLRIASATISHFVPARVPIGLIVEVFARYCLLSHTIWIAVQKIQITDNGIEQRSTCLDSLTWMTWSAYLKSEVARKPWMRARSGEYTNTFGRLSKEVVIRAWTEEDGRNKGVDEAWKGSFKSGGYYRRSLGD